MSKACRCTETKNYQSIFKEKEERNKDCTLQGKEWAKAAERLWKKKKEIKIKCDDEKTRV